MPPHSAPRCPARPLAMLLACLAGLAGATAPAAEERGRLLTRTYGVADYHASPQTLTALPLPDGRMAFTSADYLVVFDGHAWDRSEAGHATVIGGACLADDGRIYAGAVDHLGYFHEQPTGHWAYTSLDDRLEPAQRRFGPILQAIAHDGGVWFASERWVLRWKSGAFRTWNFSDQPGTVLLHRPADRLLLQRTGATGGLFESRGDAWETLGSHPSLTRRLFTGLWAEADGGFLALSPEDGFVRFRAPDFAPVAAGHPQALAGQPASSVLRLAPDRFLVGIPGRGLVDARPEGALRREWNRSHGLADQGVTCLARDEGGTLWVGSNNGVTAIDLLDGATVFAAQDGLPGGLCNDLVRHDGVLYFSLLDGLHRLQPGSPSNAAKITRVPDSPRYTHQIASHRSGLLVGNRDGLRRWSASGWEPLLPATNVFTALRTSSRDPDLAFAGYRDGLLVLRPGSAGQPGTRLHDFPGLGEVRKVYETSNALWIVTSSRGVHRIVPGTPPDPWATAQITSLPADGAVMPKGYIWVSTHLTSLGFLTSAADVLHRLNAAGDRFVPDNPFAKVDGRPIGDVPVLVETSPDRFWINGVFEGESRRASFAIAPAVRGTDGLLAPQRQHPALISALGDVGTVRCLRETGPEGEILWAVGFDGALRLETSRLPPPPPPGRVHLRGFLAQGTQQPFRETASAATARFPYSRHPFSFRFAAHRTERGAGLTYQTRMVGWDDAWSPPTDRREATWSSLPGGQYQFEARAIDADGRVSEPATLAFRVLPPAYLSGWAWGLYGILFLGAVHLSSRWRSRRAEARARHLEALVVERTRQLAAARDQAEEASRAKSRFLANMSHELRTPLNGILGFTQILHRDPGLGERNRERLRIIRTSGDHLLGLINDVLDLAKVEAGRVTLRPEPLDLRHLLRDLEATFTPRAAERGLRLSVSADAVPPTAVLADGQRLRQILENLLGNAVKFTASGEVRLEVLPAPTQPPQATPPAAPVRLAFSVRDTGPGMAPDDVARLFQPFSQAVGGRPPEAGAGLGLAISQHLAGLMGSRIEVDSAPGAGSRFHFILELPPAPSPASATSERSVVGYEGPRRRLLLVDDLEINRRLLRELLEPLGFLVTEASTGDQALAALASGTELPDLVFLDLRMPGMDGFELTRRLRERHGTALRLVATSASVLGFNIEEARAAGADGFLPKPFREAELIDLLRHQLRLTWRHAEPPAPDPAHGAAPAGAGSRPPDPLLDPLRAAASRGDVLALRRELDALRRQSPEFAPFVAELEALAAAYRMAAVRERLAPDAPAPPAPAP